VEIAELSNYNFILRFEIDKMLVRFAQMSNREGRHPRKRKTPGADGERPGFVQAGQPRRLSHMSVGALGPTSVKRRVPK